LVTFSAVEKGTEGVIDEDYGEGFMVAWDLPCAYCSMTGQRAGLECRFCHGTLSLLPAGYSKYDGKPAIQTGILRDGFYKATELKFLEVVE
jgi:hypothetical protein